MTSFVLFIIITIVLFYMSFIFESASLAMLSFGVALFVVLSFLLIIYIKLRLRVIFSYKPVIIYEGQDVSVPIIINNKSFLSVEKLRFKSYYHNVFSDSISKRWSFINDVPRGESQSYLSFETIEPGRFEFYIKKLYFYDITGIFKLRLKVNGKMDIIVLPKIKDIPVEAGFSVKNYYADTDFYSELKPGDTLNELVEVREYKPGDKLQLMHWQLSAKYDELYIRQRAKNESCAITLFFEPLKKKGLEAFNNLRAISSLSYSLMFRKLPHFVSFYCSAENDIKRIRVYDEESYYTAVISLIEQASFDNPGKLTEEYLLKYKGEPYIHYVLFDTVDSYEFDGEVCPLKKEEDLYFYFE